MPMKEQFAAAAGNCAHRGAARSRGGFQVQDINQSSYTQTNQTCIIAQKPELPSVFISSDSDGSFKELQSALQPQSELQLDLCEQLFSECHLFLQFVSI